MLHRVWQLLVAWWLRWPSSTWRRPTPRRMATLTTPRWADSQWSCATDVLRFVCIVVLLWALRIFDSFVQYLRPLKLTGPSQQVSLLATGYHCSKVADKLHVFCFCDQRNVWFSPLVGSQSLHRNSSISTPVYSALLESCSSASTPAPTRTPFLYEYHPYCMWG